MLKRKRNKIKKEIKKELKTIREKNLDDIIREIDEAPNDVKMYKSIKRLNTTTVKKNIIVHDNKGKNIINEKNKYQAVKNHFHKQLCDKTARNIQQFKGEPRPLRYKITIEEIRKVVRKLKRRKAGDKEGCKNEMIIHRGEEMIKLLKMLFDKIMVTMELPKQWEEVKIKSIH